MPCDLFGIARVTLPWPSGSGEPLRRDMTLIRMLLLSVESGGQSGRDFSAWNDETIRRHLAMMIEGGLLSGKATAAEAVVDGITWAGHEFLDSVRQDAVWRKVLKKLTETGGGLALEAVKTYALSLIP